MAKPTLLTVNGHFLPAWVFLTIGAATACGGRARSVPTATKLPPEFQASYIAHLDTLDRTLGTLAAGLASTDTASARANFRQARNAYKRVEYLLEFEDPGRATSLNGPPVPVVDEDDHTNVLQPRGLQVVEALLFSRPPLDTAKAVAQIDEMRRMVAVIRRDSTYPADRTWEVPFQASRMELARVVTLGLAGFDATLSKAGLRESAEALRGIQEGLLVYRAAMLERDPGAWRELQHSLDVGVSALEAAPDFDGFDRFGFVVHTGTAIARALARLQRTLHLPQGEEPQPWSPGATDIYAAGAIDPRWFAPDYAPAPTPELVALGRRLFSDPRLSVAGRRSCATCHQPAFGFTDRRRLAAVDPGHGTVRNTPTLLNAALQRAQFADQRVAYLEFQFEEVMANPREMGLTPDAAALRLRADSGLRREFASAFGASGDSALTGQKLSLAVAAYLRTLRALDSRFDRAIRGDTAAITGSERRGFNLFMGKAACGTCHFAPLFGGTMPPGYRESEPEVIGVPASRATPGARVDRDLGVFAVDRAPLHRHAFKTPSARNVAVTGPYMHNGVFRTLEEVVDFYDQGGGNGLGMRLPNQTLSDTPLHLTIEEKADLVAFLEALTDTSSAVR